MGTMFGNYVCMVSLPEEALKNFTTKLGRIAKQSGYVRRVSSTSSIIMEETRARHVQCRINYITKPWCCLMCVKLLILTVFCFTGSLFSYYESKDLRCSFSYYENEDRVLSLYVFVFEGLRFFNTRIFRGI